MVKDSPLALDALLNKGDDHVTGGNQASLNPWSINALRRCNSPDVIGHNVDIPAHFRPLFEPSLQDPSHILCLNGIWPPYVSKITLEAMRSIVNHRFIISKGIYLENYLTFHQYTMADGF